MVRKELVLALAAVVAGASPAVAQDAQLKQRVRVQDGGPVWGSPGDLEVMMTRRARLGVKVNLQARASDSIGAYLEGVTPGGPAAKAGLEAGDILTNVDGTPLVSNVRVDGREMAGQSINDRSLPGMRLIELAAKLAPNDTIKVVYRRGKNSRTTNLVTQEDPNNVFVMGPDGGREFTFRFNGDDFPGSGYDYQYTVPDMPGMRMREPMPPMTWQRDGDMPFKVFVSSALEELELVQLNPQLGSYFGANDGVLVISVPDSSTLGLKGGDVVLAIDGRKPANTMQMHRILQSYDPGNPVKFEVLRNKKTVTVSGTIPSPPEMKWKSRDTTMKLRSKGSMGM